MGAHVACFESGREITRLVRIGTDRIVPIAFGARWFIRHGLYPFSNLSF